ncbi:Fc receptor-like protein 5 [Cheilinus undulatus]|uniref:Fc receptor-like protein 5 n=1 Tax=Cheilinus undulatus TaxID=241271 RepID=UPI001BD59355|nr:Fc receptor-like protein 5 [Cheilinus undulatus]
MGTLAEFQRSLYITPRVFLKSNWDQIFWGETITLRCEIEGSRDTEWRYSWTTPHGDKWTEHDEYNISSDTGEYRYKPQAQLESEAFPAEGSVTLICKVKPPSSGWSFLWYRGEKTSEIQITQDEQITVTEGGLYWCRGVRGHPPYYTLFSDSVGKDKIVTNRAVVSLQTQWTEIYRGETITLRCEIKDGANTEWEYDWETTSSYKPPKQKEYSITPVNGSHTGNYSCRGRRKSDRSSTKWSRPISLTVLYNSPRPVLTVSPSWLSPGDSVTLSCDVKHPSAGWRFFWYKAIPKLAGDSYNYELLSESRNGTEKHSYIVHGETHTSGYACRAGRGDPVKFTDHSEPKFVWSGGFYSAASLTVSPDRVQHFISDSVSLICVGNSSQWRVRMFDKDSSLQDCSQWNKMTGSTCSIDRYTLRNHVFWCESGSGEFSNAVNITKQNPDIILVTPVHPVTEGDSVSLSCKVRREDTDTLSNVFFYQNDKLIQNDTRRELIISAVSKSDEGFYKCQISGRESSQSWMSVKVFRPVNWLIPMIVGLICGVVILILLALLYRYWQSNGQSSLRATTRKVMDFTRTWLNMNTTLLFSMCNTPI